MGPILVSPGMSGTHCVHLVAVKCYMWRPVSLSRVEVTDFFLYLTRRPDTWKL